MPTVFQAGRLAISAILMLAPGLAMGQDVKAGDLVIHHPWARATPNGAQVAGGYVTIINHGKTTDTLTGGSAEVAAKFELHDMVTENGVMKMRSIGPLAIAPGATVTLSPQGRHIMLIDLKHSLKKGDTVDGTLSFTHAGNIPVRFEVEAIGARAPSTKEEHGMSDMKMN